jgi:hypothetical protein
MKVLYTIPGWGRHGGVRVILEHVNRLTKWHDVTLLALVRGKCDWFDLNPKVKVIYHPQQARNIDVAVITSPHTIHWANVIRARKKLLFCQMAEHLFRPDNPFWFAKCQQFYQSPFPMMAISQWNIDLFKTEFGRTAPTHYIGNGVNLDDFPISTKPKDGKEILVEGWVAHNAAKDVDNIAPKVALRLKQEFGVRVLAYSQVVNPGPFYPDEFYCKPDLAKMNELYERATIMIKASKYDARSCSPVEAMTKGTVTARAIIQGDDDLIQQENCLRVDYNEERLYLIAKSLLNRPRPTHYEQSCREYVQTYSWDYWMNVVNAIITSL